MRRLYIIHALNKFSYLHHSLFATSPGTSYLTATGEYGHASRRRGAHEITMITVAKAQHTGLRHWVGQQNTSIKSGEVEKLNALVISFRE